MTSQVVHERPGTVMRRGEPINNDWRDQEIDSDGQYDQ